MKRKGLKKLLASVLAVNLGVILGGCSPVPQYYSEREVMHFSSQIYPEAKYLRSEKSSDGEKVTFYLEDRNGIPFTMYSYKYQPSIGLDNGPVDHVYSKALGDNYEYDMYSYHKDEIEKILKSYNLNYELPPEDTYFLDITVYIDIEDEDVENIVGRIAGAFSEIDSLLELSFEKEHDRIEQYSPRYYIKYQVRLYPNKEYLAKCEAQEWKKDARLHLTTIESSKNDESRLQKQALEEEINEAIIRKYENTVNKQ